MAIAGSLHDKTCANVIAVACWKIVDHSRAVSPAIAEV